MKTSTSLSQNGRTITETVK